MVTRNERFTENVYQKHLEAILHGGHVDYGIYGITDITTDDFHAEIKSWKSWKNVIGQLTSYNHASARLELRSYMYGDLPNKKKLESIKAYINVFHIEICQETLTITDLKLEKILLTADCFKFLCMRSKTERSQIVRKYFIELGSSNDCSLG